MPLVVVVVVVEVVPEASDEAGAFAEGVASAGAAVVPDPVFAAPLPVPELGAEDGAL